MLECPAPIQVQILCLGNVHASRWSMKAAESWLPLWSRTACQAPLASIGASYCCSKHLARTQWMQDLLPYFSPSPPCYLMCVYLFQIKHKISRKKKKFSRGMNWGDGISYLFDPANMFWILMVKDDRSSSVVWFYKQGYGGIKTTYMGQFSMHKNLATCLM